MIKNILCKVFKLVPVSKYNELEETLNVRIAELNRKIDIDASNYEANKKELCNEIVILRQENEALQSNLSSANKKIAELQTEIADYKQQISNLESALQKCKSMLDAALTDKTSLEKENSELLTNLKRKCAKIDELESSIDNYKSLLEESEELLKEKEDSIISSSAKYDNIIESLKSTEKDITIENEAYKLQIKNLQKQCEKHRVKLDFYSSQAADIAKQEEKIKEIESELSQVKQEYNNFKDINNQLKIELDDSINSNKQLTNQVKYTDQLFIENDSLKKDINKYQTLVKEYESKIQTFDRELNKTTDALIQEKQANRQQIEDLNASIDKIKTELLEKIKDKDNIIVNQESVIQSTKTINNKLQIDKKLLIEELYEAKKQNTHLDQTAVLKDKKGTKANTQQIANSEKYTTLEEYSAPKNLKLTQSVDINRVAKKAGTYKEVLRQPYEKEHINPEIQDIIEKLAKIKLEVLYKNGIFYFRSKKRGVEKLLIQHFEEYNQQLLLLYDGKEYCGFDMRTGARASERYKKKKYALAELDTYYENQYCK